MKADLSRVTFNPLKHFTRVLMQQGRVQLDADWNEQAGILLHYLQALAADLIGPHGGPIHNCGFEITQLGSSTKELDFRIGLGHYYVDGLLCEAESTPIGIFVTTAAAAGKADVQVDTWSLDGVELRGDQFVELFDDAPGSPFKPIVVQITNPDKANRKLTLQGALNPLKDAKDPKLRRVITYLHQPDYLAPEPLDAHTYQAYLDVWERQVSYVEDDSIREVALGGPDTAGRAKLVWQVKVTEPFGAACATVDQLNERFQPANRGRLKAMAKESNVSTDPCTIPPDAQYRGSENQLYRVEIHTGSKGRDGNAATPTFKFSRENGAVVLALAGPITSSGGTTTAVLETLGRDDRFGLAEGDWVEVQDDRSALSNLAGNLLQVQSIDRSAMTVTLSGAPGIEVGNDPALHPLLRRWDQKEGDPAEGGLQLGSDGAALVVEDSDGLWLTLADGVQIQFQKSDPDGPAETYRAGDYWLIPARTATGDVEWPREKDAQGKPAPIALPPQGVEHHYAPLAVITVEANGKISVKSPCLNTFKPLVELTHP